MKKLTFITFMLISSFAFGIEPVVLASPTIPEVEVNKYELINIFTRKQLFWSNGQRINVFIKPLNSIEHKIFITDVLSLTPYSYKQKLDETLYSGKNSPAIEIPNDEMMIIKISSTPNAIGYINYSIVFHTNNNEILRIKIK